MKSSKILKILSIVIFSAQSLNLIVMAQTSKDIDITNKWIKVDEYKGNAPDTMITEYIGDFKKSGDIIKMIRLFNYVPNAGRNVKSRAITDLINCKTEKYIIIDDRAYIEEWGVGAEEYNAFTSKIESEPRNWTKKDTPVYKNYCANNNYSYDQKLTDEWESVENKVTKQKNELTKWNQFVCDGNFSELIQKNQTFMRKNQQTQAGFAYHKTDEILIIEVLGAYGKMRVSSKDNEPNGVISVFSKTSESISGYYSHVHIKDYKFSVLYMTNKKSLNVKYDIGGVTTTFIGNCKAQSFL